MTWAVAVGADQRAEALVSLAEKFSKKNLCDAERSDTEQVLTLHLDDPSVKVRRSMARAIACQDDAPRTLVWSLTQDVAEVAAEIYAASNILRDADLAEAIGRNDPLIQSAIAGRAHLPGDVVRVLVDTGGARAVGVLLDNEWVILSPHLKHDIAVRMGDDPDIREQLMEEDDLAAQTRQLLAERLSGVLLTFTTSNGWVDEKRMKHVTQDASNRVAVDMSMQIDPDMMFPYVEHLRDTNQLTAALLVRASCMGNAALFEAALSLLSGASLKRVQSIVDEGRIASFGSLYNRTGLPQSAYPLFVAAITEWQKPDDAVNVVRNVIKRVENHPDIDGELFALLCRISCELARDSAQIYGRQPLLAA